MLPWKDFLRLSLVTGRLSPIWRRRIRKRFSSSRSIVGPSYQIRRSAHTPAKKSPPKTLSGYKVDTDTYIEVGKDEPDDIVLDSTRTIEIDELVPKRPISTTAI